jgi:predicted RND superfamily exporter protein
VIVIWLIMVGVLRSWGLALLFLLPNLFPIVINFGLMGFFGIPLDSGTSLIAASAFGIIVDDTVHFFVTFGAYRKRGFGIAQALEATTFEKGEAAVASFFIMVIAFGVLTLSHFQPILMFGLLNIFILVVGMVGDQVFLKSIITLWAHWLDWRDPSPSLVAKAPTGEG